MTFSEKELTVFENMIYPVGVKEGYQINRLGQVKTPKQRILEGGTNLNGYRTYGFYMNDGTFKIMTAHKLVAEHFLPNPDHLPEINHLDENKNNPCITNLEWCNEKHNANYGTRNQRISINRQIPINEFDLEGQYIRTWISANAVGFFCEEYGLLGERKVSSIARNITNSCQLINIRAYGRIWRYYECDCSAISIPDNKYQNELVYFSDFFNPNIIIPQELLYTPPTDEDIFNYFNKESKLTNHEKLIFKELQTRYVNLQKEVS